MQGGEMVLEAYRASFRQSRSFYLTFHRNNRFHKEIKMVTNEMSITIERPIKEVFAYVSDLQTGIHWQNGLLEVKRTNAGPLGVGAQFSSVRKFMGRKMASSVEFFAFEPDRKIAFKSITGDSPFVQTMLFESISEGTRVTSRLELETSGLMGLAEPLVASGLKREVATNFGVLKDLLENQVAPTSA